MEHDEKPLPIDIRLLGALAEKVRFYLSFSNLVQVPLPLSLGSRTCSLLSLLRHLLFTVLSFEIAALILLQWNASDFFSCYIELWFFS